MVILSSPKIADGKSGVYGRVSTFIRHEIGIRHHERKYTSHDNVQDSHSSSFSIATF